MKKINNFIKKFGKAEIENIEAFCYEYLKRKKVVTFVPLKYVDKLTFELAFAGAGVIGNYEICSFRMKGLGTFKPLKGAKPFSGTRGKISYEEEVRLEMECCEDKLNNVINALLKSHPYEEPAYEIYDFEKRSKLPNGYIVEFRKKINITDIICKIRDDIEKSNLNIKGYSKKLLLIDGVVKDIHITKARKSGCDHLIQYLNNKINIIKI